MLISVGAGALLAGFVMLIEPVLARDVGRAAGAATAEVAESAATEVAARIAEDRTRQLDERLSRVEGIRDIQDQVHSQRDREATQLAQRLRGVPEYSDLTALFSDANLRGLFHHLWLKCGTNRALLLNFTPMEVRRGDGLYLGWHISMTLGRALSHPQVSPGVSDHFGTNLETVLASEWMPEESFATAYRRFTDACQRANQPIGDMDFATALGSLASSYEMMGRSRNSAVDNTARLEGNLTLLVNDEWAITWGEHGSHMLEGLLDDQGYLVWPLIEHEDTDRDACPEGYTMACWEEALFYAPSFLPHRTHTEPRRQDSDFDR